MNASLSLNPPPDTSSVTDQDFDIPEQLLSMKSQPDANKFIFKESSGSRRRSIHRILWNAGADPHPEQAVMLESGEWADCGSPRQKNPPPLSSEESLTEVAEEEDIGKNDEMSASFRGSNDR